MTEHISTDNSGKILTSTLWNQSGKVVVQINGKNHTFTTRYNEYAPYYQENTISITGCTNTADSQIIYYWLEKGYADELNFTVNATDSFNVKWNGSTVSVTLGTADSKYKLLSIEEINELLLLKDIVPVNGAPYNGDEDLARFVAILNLYCGIKNSSSYGGSTSTSSLSSGQYYTGSYAKAFKAAGFDSYYRIGVLSGTMAKKIYDASSYTFTELGHSILQENLDYGEIIRVGIPGHAIYMDGYRIVNGEYQYHLNYGWGNSSSTKWYTIDQLAAIKIDDIGIDISPDTNVVVSSDKSEYYGGSFLRGMERVNHIQTTRTGDDYVEFVFADDIAGSTVFLYETANITSQSDVHFDNINVSIASKAQVVFQSPYDMSFDLNSGSILAYAVGTTDTVIKTDNNSVLTVDMDASYIYCGDYSQTISILQQDMQQNAEGGYVFNDFSNSFISGINGYSLVSGSGDDSVTLNNNSAILGEMNLGGGKNTLNIENGSLIYGGITANSGSLSVSMLISGSANGSMIVMDEADDDSAFYYATGGVLNVTLEQCPGEKTIYSLLDCYTSSWLSKYVVNVKVNDFEFTLNDSHQSENIFFLRYDNSELQLGIESVIPEVLDIRANKTTLTNRSVTLNADFSDSAEKKLYSFDTLTWYDYQSSGVIVDSNMTVYFKAENILGHASEIKSCTVSNIDKTPPALEISGNPTEWTNKDVTLCATVDEGIVEFFNGSKWLTQSTATVYKNGTYKFRATDAAGNFTEKSVTVDKIDRENPVLTVNGLPTALTNEDVLLTADTNEGTIEFFDGSEWLAQSTATVSRNGIYFFRATDIAGNRTVQTVIIDMIDKIAPELEISGNPTEWTNKDVTLCATADEGIVEFFNGTEWIIQNSITVSENGTYSFRATDAAGNMTEQTVTVDKIDKVAPELEISGNPTEFTSNDVILTASSSDGTVEYFNGKTWIAGNTLTVTKNGTYQFRAIDGAGNVTEQNISVNSIDKDAPVLEISGNSAVWTNKDIILTARANEGIIEYFNGSEWVAESTVVVTQNGVHQFRATDSVGNVTLQNVYVVTIDKIAPTLTISGNTTEWTSSDVTLTASANTGTVEYFNGSEWIAGNSITATENGTYKFRASDLAGNITEQSVTVDRIDKTAAPVPEIVNISTGENNVTIDWSDVADEGSGIAGYCVRLGNSSDLSGEGEFVTESMISIPGLEVAEWFIQVQSVDAVGNRSEWSSTAAFEIADKPVLTGDKNGVEFTNIPGNAKVEFSKDDFASVLAVDVDTNAVDTYGMPAGIFQWQVCANGTCLQGGNIASDNIVTPEEFVSDADGNIDVFFADTDGIWEKGYGAQHQGSGNWQGTRENVLLEGKNKIADVFTGSTDANILLLTDSDNGDALFIDDIYTAPGDQVRLTQIDEIRAGAGNDTVDMTSQQFAYVGNGATIYGGAGDDTIWANSGNNTLFGDAGNDRLVGANGNDIITGGAGNDSMHGGGGDDIFCFGANWGNDTVEQLSDGSVTLHFETGSEANWDADTLTYTDGVNSVTVSGVTEVSLVFGGTAPVEGAFLDAASEKVFEDKSKNMIA